MRKVLQPPFFDRPALDVARDLLGKHLVCNDGGREVSMMISEVEAYDGFEDKASHAFKGKTGRAGVMFGSAGHWYVYLIYGMYHMLNIVTGPEGYPAAILIRGTAEVSGPGRLTKALGISKGYDSLPATKETGLWIEDRGIVVEEDAVIAAPRIGVDYAGEWKDKPYRFLLTGV